MDDLTSWNAEYEEVIPLDTKEREGDPASALIDRLDQEGMALQQSVWPRRSAPERRLRITARAGCARCSNAPPSLRRHSRTLAQAGVNSPPRRWPLASPLCRQVVSRRATSRESVVGFAPLEDEVVPELTAVEKWRSEKEHPFMAAPCDRAEADRRLAFSSSRESEGIEVGPERSGC